MLILAVRSTSITSGFSCYILLLGHSVNYLGPSSQVLARIAVLPMQHLYIVELRWVVPTYCKNSKCEPKEGFKEITAYVIITVSMCQDSRRLRVWIQVQSLYICCFADVFVCLHVSLIHVIAVLLSDFPAMLLRRPDHSNKISFKCDMKGAKDTPLRYWAAWVSWSIALGVCNERYYRESQA